MSKAIWDGSFLLIDQDRETGRLTWVEFLENGGMRFRIDYPVADLVKVNQVERNETAGNRFGEWAKVASIPLNLYYDSGFAEAIAQGDRKFTSRWLNDSDNRAWRTKEGKV
jgi:hypothetical protein